MGSEVEARRYHRGIAASIIRLGGQVQIAVWLQIRQLERDRSLNALLVVGLVTINLAAFGTAYWWATRDILSEVSGEVLVEWMEAPNGPAARSQATRTRSVKRSSLSTGASSSAREPEAELALPLPPSRMRPPAAPKAQPSPRLTVPVIVMDEPLTSPITTPPQERAIQRPPAVTPTGKRTDLESP